MFALSHLKQYKIYLNVFQLTVGFIWRNIWWNGYDNIAITIVDDIDPATRNINRQAPEERRKEKTTMRDHYVELFVAKCNVNGDTNQFIKQ